jgi:hypothetical protein
MKCGNIPLWMNLNDEWDYRRRTRIEKKDYIRWRVAKSGKSHELWRGENNVI